MILLMLNVLKIAYITDCETYIKIRCTVLNTGERCARFKLAKKKKLPSISL